MIASDRLAEIFVEAADTLVDDFDVIEFLETLTNRTAQVSSAASAGLLLSSPTGQLQYVASSTESIKLLELFQLQYEEGPCLDCFNTGEPVVNAEASAEGDAGAEDDEIVAQIKDLLETRVRPAVAQDGGDIVFQDFRDGVVYLHMQGSCSGCPSSTATLKMGIENLLKHYVPEVVEVQAAQ